MKCIRSVLNVLSLRCMGDVLNMVNNCSKSLLILSRISVSFGKTLLKINEIVYAIGVNKVFL